MTDEELLKSAEELLLLATEEQPPEAAKITALGVISQCLLVIARNSIPVTVGQEIEFTHPPLPRPEPSKPQNVPKGL